jgi:hypothetical protein
MAVYQFMKWAFAPFRDLIKYGQSLSMSAMKPNDLTPLHRMIFYDSHGSECCSRYWIDGPMDPITGEETKSQYLKGRGRCCGNIVCQLSHELPVIPYHFLKSLDASINYQATLLSISRLFGDEFIWKKEPYIQRLFDTMSDKYQTERRHDPMTRRNEVIRETTQVEER